MIIIFNVIFLVLVAITILFSRNLLTDIILLGIFSFLMTIFYVMVNAPDVAITEAAIGSSLSTVFALSALLLYKDSQKIKDRKFSGTIIIVMASITLYPLLLYFPQFGAPISNKISDFYIENTVSMLGFTNIVTGILASFRGFDTFIETIVIFTAATSVYMLIGQDE